MSGCLSSNTPEVAPFPIPASVGMLRLFLMVRVPKTRFDGPPALCHASTIGRNSKLHLNMDFIYLFVLCLTLWYESITSENKYLIIYGIKKFRFLNNTWNPPDSKKDKKEEGKRRERRREGRKEGQKDIQ